MKVIIKLMIHDHGDRTLLGHSDAATIEICACGTVHVTVGPITMRIQPAALRQLALAAREADARLSAMAIEPSRFAAGMAS